VLIWNQKREVAHFVCSHKWKDLGRQVKKGEKGIVILAPIVRRIATKTEEEEERLFGIKIALETEAEAVSFVVCKAVGLDTNTTSSDYILLYDGKKETLMKSLERIREASGRILGMVADGLIPDALS